MEISDLPGLMRSHAAVVAVSYVDGPAIAEDMRLAAAAIEWIQETADRDWTRKLTILVGQCIADQRNGDDVLASASWDAVVEYWTALENGRTK